MRPCVRAATLVLFCIFLISLADAAVVDFQPITMCNDGWTNCADPTGELYQAEGAKIWSQASIGFNYRSWVGYRTDDPGWGISDPAWDGSLNSQYVWNAFGYLSDLRILNVWFVPTITWCGGTVPVGYTVYGCGAVGAGLAVMSNAVFSAHRVDSIYHEIGHNFGLPHTADNDPYNLMTDGSYRYAATSIDQITPDGDMRDRLTADQIQIALSSDLITPEPVSLGLAGAGIAFLLLLRSRS